MIGHSIRGFTNQLTTGNKVCVPCVCVCEADLRQYYCISDAVSVFTLEPYMYVLW